MKKLSLIGSLFLCFALFSIVFSACKKEETGGTATVHFKLTDGPADYDAVLLDIQEVNININGAWETLIPLRPGVYNILDFRNGLDTLLGTVVLPVGNISQIRLVLGNDNAVVIDGNTYALKTPSGQQSGVKLNLNTTLEPGLSYTVWLDFDAAKSVVETGSANYILKPVIRAYADLTNGRIAGIVGPLAANPIVYAVNGIDTFAAIPSLSGDFLISGLPDGLYNVIYDADPLTPYKDTVITGIPVTYGTIYTMPTVTLVP